MTEAELTDWIAALKGSLLNVAEDGAARVEIDGMEIMRTSPESIQKMLASAYNQLAMLKRSNDDENPLVYSAPVKST